MDPPGELGRYKPHYGKSIETNVTLDSGNYRKKGNRRWANEGEK